MNIWLNFLIDSLAFGATFMYGSTGEILTEKAGHLNLGIPGVMCMGGAGGCLVLNLIGKSGLPGFVIVILGILGALVTAMLMGLIYSFLTVTLRANQNVTGLALTTFGAGLMKVIMSKLDATVYLVGPKMLYRWPFAGRTDALQCLGVMFFLAVIIAVVASWVLYRTKVGLHLRAVGENPATADAVGINVTKYKYVASCVGSGIAGLGGFYYIIDYMASQEAYLSLEVFGWLSIALVIFALWRPHMTIIGSTVFGLLFSCSSYIANIEGINVTMAAKPLMKMLPYVFTIAVLIFTSIRNKRENQPPASLGLSYFREER
ncbi:MAG: ABC transporter permease [Clostridia bacterium]|nr:ABC transporter permease [Clostridia bacterium]